MENGRWQMENGKASRRPRIPFSIFHFPFSILVLLFLTGCAHNPPKRGVYTGPTETMYEVVKQINANNDKLPTLFATLDTFEASIVDDRARRFDEVFGGQILYRAPRELRVVGTKGLGSVVEIGSSNLVYWLTARSPGPDTLWWGHYENLGKECSRDIPVRPDLILEVLGVTPIKEDFNRLPAPVMRFNDYEDAYMFLWMRQESDRFVAVKEVWYDRKTKRPRKIALFDGNGRVVLQAWLSKHRAVEAPNVPEAQWPTVATEYKLSFPDRGVGHGGSKIFLRFDQVMLKRKNLPSDASFQFNPDRVSVKTKIQLDEACGP